MAGWLRKPVELLGKRPPPPAPYEVACVCGARLSGVRAAAAQKRSCEACARPVFILPANVYPLPKSSQAAAPKPVAAPAPPKPDPLSMGQYSANPAFDLGTDEDAGGGSDANRDAGGRSRVPGFRKRTTKDVTSRDTSPDRPAGKPDSLAPPVRPFRLTPLRMVAAAGVLLILGTGYVIWSRLSYEQAAVTYKSSFERGRTAFLAQDFATADTELGRAARAVQRLGRRDLPAQTALWMAREAAAANNLLPSSWSDLMAELVPKANRTADWKDFVSRHVRGEYVILDGPLVRDAESRNGQGWAIDFPVGDDQIAVDFEIDAPEIRRIAQGLSDASPLIRVIFAAQIEDIEPPAGVPPTVRVRLRGSSVVLWSHLETLQAVSGHEWMGAEQDAANEVLQAQRKQNGIE